MEESSFLFFVKDLISIKQILTPKASFLTHSVGG